MVPPSISYAGLLITSSTLSDMPLLDRRSPQLLTRIERPRKLGRLDLHTSRPYLRREYHLLSLSHQFEGRESIRSFRTWSIGLKILYDFWRQK